MGLSLRWAALPPALLACFGACAADLSPPASQISLPSLQSEPLSPVYAHFGIGGLFLSESAKIFANGALVPGANIRAREQYTPVLEIGYYFTPNVAVSFTGGIPPLVKVTGAGSIAQLGTLGKVIYGPTTLTAHYHFVDWGNIRPYIGGGLVGLLVFQNKDGAFSNLSLKPNIGAVVQAGLDYQITERWSAFIDVKKAYLRSTATGNFGGASIKSRVVLDPLVVSTGVGYRF